MLRALRFIEEEPTISHREIAARAGISVGAAHYCIKALTQKGLIQLSSFPSSGPTRRSAYLLTPSGLSAKCSLTAKSLKRKIAEYESLKAEISELERSSRSSTTMGPAADKSDQR